MNRVYLRTLLFTSGAILVPTAIYAASFQGPGAGCTPPNCNVPGVIWNMDGSGQTQTGAEIKIDGKAVFGDSSDKNEFFGDNVLQSSKAFRVDSSSAATFNMGNWYLGVSRALSFTTYGDLYVDRVNPYVGVGLEGRVQARKFCFYPGTGPSDCLTTWNSGLNVLKTGDVMTGGLGVLSSGNGAAVSATSSAGWAVQAVGGAAGGGGLFTNNNSSPASTAKLASGGFSGDFTGKVRITTTAPASPSTLEINSYNDGTAIDTTGGGITAGGITAEGVTSIVNVTADNAGSFQKNLTSGNPGTALFARSGLSTGTYTAGGYGVSAEAYGPNAIGVSGSATIHTGGKGGSFNGSLYGITADGAYGGYLTGSSIGLRAADSDGTSYGYVGYGDWSFYGPQNAYIGGAVGINTTSMGSFALNVNGTAAKTGGGSWSVPSDERLKDIEGTYNAGLDDVMKIDPIRYHYKKDNAKDLDPSLEYIGVSAQQVEKVIPEAVQKDELGYRSVNNDPIIWAMLNSIKQLKVENEALKDRLDQLEQK